MSFNDPQRFTVTDAHLTLLRAAYVRWEDIETGAPAIDGKRPYGNGDVPRDMAELLGVEPAGDEYGDAEELSRDQREELLRLHRETETALQIVLVTGAFEAGEYEASPYRIDWRKVAAAGQGENDGGA
jgi:hypothetical protein